ncbi:MAG: glutamine synthetase III [Lachnospiraceae bacterium]|nr:glutamine synthetase III [Lachnospiraceae bacterium]
MKANTGFEKLFSEDVFNEERMKEYLSAKAFSTWKKCIDNSTQLDPDCANEIASAMKEWALARGATHYTHWFQPLTGATAEKHDSFIAADAAGRLITDFSGKHLIKGEPDASSFPSGGLRATFEARGYTAWDPTSYAFVKDATLYIPTIFCSYSGYALDKKTPLLRSMDLISREAVRILRLFGDKKTRRVIAQCGPEQEYFLIDKALYQARDDLKMTGRTLFGAPAARGQETEDHYYGQIKPRVLSFMQELDESLWKLGVPAKTRHNEAAPSQHEIAILYRDANTAADANQLTMELLKKIADRHGFVCLLHEKPFSGVNGSGKHDNWSLMTDGGKNLFKPGSTPLQNAQFLLFLAAFIKGVDEYQDTLRATVATSGNEHRLGALEAPPAIISVYLGDELGKVIDTITKGVSYKDRKKEMLKVGVDVMPPIPLDNTDRNRTSPMAFTGNKFEFRMVGSSQSVSGPNIALNTIMAEELKGFADRLEKAKNFQKELQQLLKEVFSAHKRIIFDGNGYDGAWEKEAKKRGLSNLATTMEALPHYVSASSLRLFTANHIYTEEELRARYNIHVDTYNRTLIVEARTMVNMIRKQILPAVSGFGATLCERAKAKEALAQDAAYERKTSAEISRLTDLLDAAGTQLARDLGRVPKDKEKAMRYIGKTIRADMQKAREAADALEEMTDTYVWPFPVYSDLLFSE